MQEWFIDIIGYHCPLAIWSCNINDKYGLNIWKKPEEPSFMTAKELKEKADKYFAETPSDKIKADFEEASRFKVATNIELMKADRKYRDKKEI